jgi:hypothetical protein
MLKAADEIGVKVKADGRAENGAAVAAMQKRGLRVQTVSPEIAAEWQKVLEGLQDGIRGKIVPTDVYDEAQAALKEYRSKHSPK